MTTYKNTQKHTQIIPYKNSCNIIVGIYRIINNFKPNINYPNHLFGILNKNTYFCIVI